MSDSDNTAAGGEIPAVFNGLDPFGRSDPPLFTVSLWPHRSMTRRGFRWFLGLLAAGLSIPLVSVWGTPVALFLTPFLLAALAFAWVMIELNYRAGRLVEELRIWPDAIAVERREPRGRVLRWAANPYWVTVGLNDTPTIEKYLTLTGGGRTIELGAFLTPEERVDLAGGLRDALRRAVMSAARR